MRIVQLEAGSLIATVRRPLGAHDWVEYEKTSPAQVVERLAGARAYGPVLHGVRLPINDLSRGCSADDIVAMIAVACLQGGWV